MLANAPGEAKQSFLNEINMMKKVARGNSYNVVRMVGCVSIQSPYALVLEYVPYGSLLDYLRENRKLVSAFAVLLTSVPPLTANTSVGLYSVTKSLHLRSCICINGKRNCQKPDTITVHAHTYATCYIHMLHVTYICYMLHTYATCYIHMLHVAYVCYMLHTYATCYIRMLHVAYIRMIHVAYI